MTQGLNGTPFVASATFATTIRRSLWASMSAGAGHLQVGAHPMRCRPAFCNADDRIGLIPAKRTKWKT